MSSKDDGREPFPPSCGYVYAVVNPVWPGVVKLGQTFSIQRRYGAYLTSDPYRAYRMLGWSDLLAEPWKAEKMLHTQFADQRVADSREWFRITEAQALAALNALRRQPMLAGTAAQPEQAPDGWYSDADESDEEYAARVYG